MNDYYVYVYIDPRNHEEFYYGKGRGSRKEAHLTDKTDSEKAKRIKEIKKEKLNPIIKVIAKDLTEKEALLIEKTLLWKSGKYTTNMSTGHYSDNFRPPNTLHKELSKFDFQTGVYYFNVGEKKGSHRSWDDCRNYGFISAGQGKIWKDAILRFNVGDIIVAYLKNHGYVGLGRIKQKARMIKDVKIKGKPLLSYKLKCKIMGDNSNDIEKSEYVALVDWIKQVPRNQAKWKRKFGLYTTELIRASLEKQPKTIEFIERQFNIKLEKYLR